VTSTESLGSLHIVLQPSDGTEGAHYFFQAPISVNLEPGESFAELLFFTGIDFSPGFVVSRAEVESGSVSQAVTQGSGTKALLIASPEDRGAAVSVGFAAAGFLRHGEDVDTGIVGGIADSACSWTCWGDWRSPDGKTGSWMLPIFEGAEPPLPSSGQLLFAGPSGRWDWAWNGNRDRVYSAYSPAFAAWAPIGSAWCYFREVAGNCATED
jgi:hypothetical protein